jgi:hypothetical protein
MRKILIVLPLLLLLVLMLAYGRERLLSQPPAPVPESPAPVAAPVAAPASPAAVPATIVPAASLPADQLIVQAVGADAALAQQAQDALQKLGQCPHLVDSPEGPVGLAAASFGLHDNDADRVRSTILQLVRLGCDLDQYSAVGLTPLHGAVIGKQPELVRYLLEQGADPKLRVIHIPGKELGRSIANLDAYGLALALRRKFPDDDNLKAITEILKPKS